MDLGRDLLDNALVDREGHPLGRVDGILIEFRGNKPPRVTAMTVGVAPLAYRIHPVVERIVRSVARWLRVSVEPVRVPMQTIRDIGVDVEIEPDRSTRGELLAVERWLARRVIGRLPGGRA